MGPGLSKVDSQLLQVANALVGIGCSWELCTCLVQRMDAVIYNSYVWDERECLHLPSPSFQSAARVRTLLSWVAEAGESQWQHHVQRHLVHCLSQCRLALQNLLVIWKPSSQSFGCVCMAQHCVPVHRSWMSYSRSDGRVWLCAILYWAAFISPNTSFHMTSLTTSLNVSKFILWKHASKQAYKKLQTFLFGAHFFF